MDAVEACRAFSGRRAEAVGRLGGNELLWLWLCDAAANVGSWVFRGERENGDMNDFIGEVGVTCTGSCSVVPEFVFELGV